MSQNPLPKYIDNTLILILIFIFPLSIYNCGSGNSGPAANIAVTVSGTVQYQDRLFDRDGFTGSEPLKPIRYADIEIVRDSDATTIGSTYTDENGAYSTSITVPEGTNIYVRALTSTSGSGKKVSVRSHSTSGHPIFSITSSIFSAYNTTYEKNLTATVASGTASIFNVFDTMLNGAIFIKSLTNAEPTTAIIAKYDISGSTGTYYDGTDLFICGTGCSGTDSDGWDDVIILHEFSHYIAANYSKDDSPGGAHYLDYHYDLKLAWSEGWATFSACAIRDYIGETDAEYYVDMRGSEGSEEVGVSYEIETPSVTPITITTANTPPAGRPYAAGGADNEVVVSALLWDIYDSDNSDTGGFDTLSEGIGDSTSGIWNIMSNYLTTSDYVSLEDFWDGWLSNESSDLTDIFEAHLVFYKTDTKEVNNSYTTATQLNVNTPLNNSGDPLDYSQNVTLYGDGDADWYKFTYSSASDYTISTTHPGDGADTYIELYDTDGTLITYNDDADTDLCTTRHNPDCSSEIVISGSTNRPSSGDDDKTVYLKVFSSPTSTNPANYGNYNIKVTSP